MAPTFVEVIQKDVVVLPPHDSLKDLGLNDIKNPTKVTVKDNTVAKALNEYLPTVILVVFAGVVFLFLFGRMGGGANGPMAFIKSRAKLYDPNKDPVSFKDVA